MLTERQCIDFWLNHLSNQGDKLTDHQYTIITSTVAHLKELVKLKENPELPYPPFTPLSKRR